ncbi:SAM-dependent methyltransferase [Actinoplanes sp. NPDC026623]|uniref:SAM-dependent methyltransferase n=1 Tax=Actinoplanes sp. NPDC026623 TaxID=3155610 RepID=UPI0033F04ADC
MAEQLPNIETRIDLRTDRPHPARVYDYLLGGKDNFAADREAAQRGLRANPDSRIPPRENRLFLRRAVRFLAEQGIDQFLDIGTGIPSAPNVHHVAQEINPRSRVVYVDNDPIVLVHARALLTSHPEGRTDYLGADLRDVDRILDSAVLGRALDLSRPVGLLLIAVLHFIGDEDDPGAIVRRLLAGLPPGSHLALSHLTGDFRPEAWEQVAEVYRRQGVTMKVRSRSEIAGFFTGLKLVEPGLQVLPAWRPDLGDPTEPPPDDGQVSVYGGVARKQ